jgi:hypothetical protein
MAEPKTLTPAYVPFKTFIAVLESFSSFLPDQIHPTMWPSYSGGIKSQLLGALRFFALIDEDNRPTDALHRLKDADPQQRPALFRAVMKAAYGTLMSVDLTKATPGSFDAEMRKFGQEGDTHRKAASFFLQAAKWSGLPLSPLLTKKGSLSGSRRRKAAPNGTNRAAGRITDAPVVLPDNEDAIENSLKMVAPGVKKVMHLDNNAVLTLTIDRNFGELPSKQRRFVNELIDRIEEFSDQCMAEDEADFEARQQKVSS